MSDVMTPRGRQGAVQEPGKDAAGNNHKSLQKSTEVAAQKKRRRGPRIVGLVVLVVLLAVGVYYGRSWLLDTLNYVSTDDAFVDGNHVTISAKMLGRIKTVMTAEGSAVKPGQLLVTLDDTDLRAQEAQATAALNYAQQNSVLAKINLDKAQDDFQRSRNLFNGGATTREQYEHAQKALDTADAQYTIAEAQVENSRAQLQVIETQLLNTRITAPIAGTVAKQAFMPGDVVQPGQAIFTVNDLVNLWVTANYEETKLGRIAVGAPVQIHVDAHPAIPFVGRVSMIGSGIVSPAFSIGEFTKTTQRVPVKILFESVPQGTVLLPGMSVEVKVKASGTRSLLPF